MIIPFKNSDAYSIKRLNYELNLSSPESFSWKLKNKIVNLWINYCCKNNTNPLEFRPNLKRWKSKNTDEHPDFFKISDF